MYTIDIYPGPIKVTVNPRKEFSYVLFRFSVSTVRPEEPPKTHLVAVADSVPILVQIPVFTNSPRTDWECLVLAGKAIVEQDVRLRVKA